MGIFQNACSLIVFFHIGLFQMYLECTHIYLVVYVTLLMGLCGEVHSTTVAMLMEVTFTFWGAASFFSKVKQYDTVSNTLYSFYHLMKWLHKVLGLQIVKYIKYYESQNS